MNYSGVSVMFVKNLILVFIFLSFSSFCDAMHTETNDSAHSSILYKSHTELNLMWLNTELNPDQEDLFPKNKASNLQMVLDWAEKNVDLKYPINLWFCSKTTSKSAVENTKNALKSSSKEIILRDKWDLDYIKTYPSAFDDKQDIYFNADLSRMAVLLRPKTHPQESEARYRVYADLNVPSLSLSSMFTDEKRKTKFGDLPADILSKYGFALSVNNAGDITFAYENAFLVLDTKHEIAWQALQFGVLDINRIRGETFASKNYWATYSVTERKKKSQIVFTSFQPMMQYYKYLTGEYGIEADPADMPKTLEEKILKLTDPLELFNLENEHLKVKCKIAKNTAFRDYVGYQRAGQNHPEFGPIDKEGYVRKTRRELYKAPMENLLYLTIQVNKPMSSFYNKN